MGCFPYECPGCGGAYKRCGQEDHKDPDECERCEDGDSEDQEKCDNEGHLPCSGGQFCWSDDVVAVPEREQKYCLEDEVLNFIVYGKYDSYGGIEDIQDEKHKAYKYFDVGMTKVSGITPEESSESDEEGLTDLVLVRFWCKECYEKKANKKEKEEKKDDTKKETPIKPVRKSKRLEDAGKRQRDRSKSPVRV